MVALNVTQWTPYNAICRHAEALYAGEIRFNWKDIVKLVLQPLQTAGLVEIRKKAKQGQKTPEGRGGKATDVKPTGRFEKESGSVTGAHTCTFWARQAPENHLCFKHS